MDLQENNNPEEQKQHSLGDALHKGEDALKKAKKTKDKAENVAKVIKFILHSKTALIAIGVFIAICMIIIMVANFLHFLDLDHNKKTIKAKEKAFSSQGILERRKNYYR